MSDPIVRAEFRKRIGEFLTQEFPAVPFYDTVNTNDDNITDREWVSCHFEGLDMEKTCYSDGATLIESGTVDVYVFTRAGTGDARATEIASKLAKWFRNDSGAWSSKDQVVVESVLPPAEAFESDTRKWFTMAVSMSYTAPV